MVVFVFTKYGQKRFSKLPKLLQDRIIKKIKQLKKHQDILSVLKPLYNFEPATHLLRIGDYRVILELKSQKINYFEFFILDIGHRRDIYQ